ncbi:MAG: hypothetical protein JSW58_10325 [Candidatus Latescibacterota bacterium]|nr:MAG: hypothetical protein JSW58_10325 [Candidatus Latescibacterota bacterium]
MKTLVVMLAVSLAIASVAAADVCIKQETLTDEYYYGGRIRPAQETVAEMWFGEKKWVYITEHRKIVVDLTKNSLLFANLDDSTYAETTLPLDWANLADEQTVGFLQQYPRKGTVESTDETKKIDGRQCRLFKTTSWIPVDQGKYDERDESIWASTDLPIDWESYGEIQSNIFTLMNYGDEYAEELKKINGLPISLDAEVFIKGFSVKSTERIQEVIEKDPPADIYSAPKGFTKKEKLSMQDIRG